MDGKVQDMIDRRKIDNGLKKGIRHKEENEDFDVFLDNESKAYAEHLATILPESIRFDLKKNVYTQLRDGIVFAFALNEIKKGSIDLNRLINPVKMEEKNGIFEATANLSKVLYTAKEIGIRTINIGPEDILYENKGLVLGLLWQVVRMSITKTANVLKRPELVKLLEENESIRDIVTKQPEELILRWVNYHLDNAQKMDHVIKLKEIVSENATHKIGNIEDANRTLKNLKSVFNSCFISRSPMPDPACIDDDNLESHYDHGVPIKCKNFSGDIKNSKIYLVLMKQIAPFLVNDEELFEAWKEKEVEKRAVLTLKIAEKLGCKKFVTEKEIVTGDSRLNFLFVVTLFNKYIGITPPSTEKVDSLIQEIEKYKSEIAILESQIREINTELHKMEKLETEKESLKEEFMKNLEKTSNLYENAIEDMKTSIDSFTSKVTKFVKNNAGITFSDERCDSKQRIWDIVGALVSEIKKIKEQREDFKSELQRKKMIDKLIDQKLVEYIEIQRIKAIPKKKKNIRDLFGCNK